MTIAIRVSLPSISATFGLWFLCCSYLPLMLSLRKQPTSGDATTGFPAKWRLRNEGRNSILMTRHYPDLGSTSDWLNQISYAARPIRSPNQIWVVTRHQYGISALVSQTSFPKFVGVPPPPHGAQNWSISSEICLENNHKIGRFLPIALRCFTHTCHATNQVVFRLQKNVEEIRGYFYLPRQASSLTSDVTPLCSVTPGKFIQSEVSIHTPFNNLICCKTVWVKRAT